MPIVSDPSKLDPQIRGRWEADGRPEQNYIVCGVAKGPWIVRGGPEGLYVVTDLKTAGYPYRNAIGKLILKGGNWTKDRKGWVASTSKELYLTETSEELDHQDPVLQSAARAISGSLAKNTRPFGNYFTETPRSSHGHPKKGYGSKGVVRHFNSIFVSEISWDELCDRLQVPRQGRHGMLAGYLSKISPESAVSVIGYGELNDMAPEKIGGLLPFGEGVILADVLRGEYGWDGEIKPDESVVALRLNSDPVVVYRDLEERKLFETDPLKEDAEDEHAFRENKPATQ